jgi:phage terminase large subunit
VATIEASDAVQIELPPLLRPLFVGAADVRASRGGRGSAKTRSFAMMAAVKGYMFGMEGISGIILCARQFMNSLEDSSLEEVKRAIEGEPFLKAYYKVTPKSITSHDGRISFSFAGLDRNIASVKSKGRILLCWVDEAEPVSDAAWATLIPTLREEGEDWNAELWVSWNPKRKTSPAEKRFANSSDPLVRCVTINWRDNPKFPAKLERDRVRDKAERPDQYEHIWEGDFATAITGAYYAPGLAEAKKKGRIGRVTPDPLLTIRSYHDIGGAGAKADAYTIWVVQFVNHEIRILDYYESQGQTLAFHVNWMRDQGWRDAQVYLPHDGTNTNNITGKKYRDHWEDAEFDVTVIPNQGQGASMQRVEAARRIFNQCWFNEDTTESGREALGFYHEKRDETRDVGLGPDHDWASHAADAFGLMAIDYEPPRDNGDLMKSLYGKSGKRGSFLNS